MDLVEGSCFNVGRRCIEGVKWRVLPLRHSCGSETTLVGRAGVMADVNVYGL